MATHYFEHEPVLASSRPPRARCTIVTGASSNHFHCLRNLLVTVRHSCPDAVVVVYDLGLSGDEASEIGSTGVELRRFDFARYPEYMNIALNAGEYAWKPVIFHEVLEDFGSLVMWLDAGNLVVRDLTLVWLWIRRYGILTPHSAGDLREWTHPKTLQHMNVPAEDLDKPNRNAALVGLNADYPWARQLCLDWRNAALCRDCIAPQGSSRENHRQDQALLSILFYRYERQIQFAAIDQVGDISIHNDDLSRADVEQMLAYA